MSALATLGYCTAGMAGMAATVGAVALVASPINRARDDRRAAAEKAAADALIAQIRAGASFARGLDDDPRGLTAAAYRLARYLAPWVGPDGAAPAWFAVDSIRGLLVSQGLEEPEFHPTALTPVGVAAGLQLLLHRLKATYLRPASVAGAYVADALRYLPDGAAVDFCPLHEFDPAPLHAARAVWWEIADAAGMLPDAQSARTTRPVATAGG